MKRSNGPGLRSLLFAGALALGLSGCFPKADYRIAGDEAVVALPLTSEVRGPVDFTTATRGTYGITAFSYSAREVDSLREAGHDSLRYSFDLDLLASDSTADAIGVVYRSEFYEGEPIRQRKYLTELVGYE